MVQNDIVPIVSVDEKDEENESKIDHIALKTSQLMLSAYTALSSASVVILNHSASL
jgi:hypothetical protein